MRSEISSDSETGADECVLLPGEPEIPLDRVLTYEELSQLEEDFFGKPKELDTDAPLEWQTLKPDNFLVKQLKQIAGLFAYSIKKEAEATEKDIKRARRVFYGR